MRAVSSLKIPTLFGLGLIVAGISAGVLLVAKDQIFFAQASPDVTPQNITLSNITDTQVNISWQTSPAAPSFLTLNIKNNPPQTIVDDQDDLKPKPHFLHYVTIKKLDPDTNYSFKIISGRVSSDEQTFKTAKASVVQNNLGPVRGTAFEDKNPVQEGIAFLAATGAAVQSTPITSLGNFIIPLSQLRKEDLSDIFQSSTDTIDAKLTIISAKGSSSALIKIKPEGIELPPILLGQNVDLTSAATASPTPTAAELNVFDLNNDGQINALDYSILLQNFGKNPKNRKADLNNDGVVDNKDLEIISKHIEGLANQ